MRRTAAGSLLVAGLLIAGCGASDQQVARAGGPALAAPAAHVPQWAAVVGQPSRGATSAGTSHGGELVIPPPARPAPAPSTPSIGFPNCPPVTANPLGCRPVPPLPVPPPREPHIALCVGSLPPSGPTRLASPPWICGSGFRALEMVQLVATGRRGSLAWQVRATPAGGLLTPVPAGLCRLAPLWVVARTPGGAFSNVLAMPVLRCP
ncbi:MAG TPA: hypothetical protein VET65_08180 [Candidatus Limnocylindrales bacterium]|nr:hypothetical protein [Candidatus Limnocylindrales bacterium]